MSYPDLPLIPDIASHRLSNLSVQTVLGQARGALHAAERALHGLEHGAPTEIQPALVRQVVIECRRSTFVLQKLSSRVDGFDAWYSVRRAKLSGDPLMRYFHNLRNQIEKQGLPGMMAELFDRTSGETMADVACGEDRHGIWVSGSMRLGIEFQAGTISDASEKLGLRNFRLPDPPLTHRGRPIEDYRFSALASRAISFLWDEVLEPADSEFGDRPQLSEQSGRLD